MTSEEFEQIRDKDHVVLKHIQQGHDDVQKITAKTTLENHHVSYSLKKLQKLGLLTVEKPDTMVERVIDGQKRIFQHPKQAELTKVGEDYVTQMDKDETNQYSDLSHRELVRRTRDLEDRITDMEQKFEIFRRQVVEKMDS